MGQSCGYCCSTERLRGDSTLSDINMSRTGGESLNQPLIKANIGEQNRLISSKNDKQKQQLISSSTSTSSSSSPRHSNKTADYRSRSIVFGYISAIELLFNKTDIDLYKSFNNSNPAHTIILQYYYEAPIPPLPDWFITTYNKDDNNIELYADLAGFLKLLPQKSRMHIWEHSVKNRSNYGKKIAVNKTQNLHHISALLADCLIVYIKFKNRDKPPIKSRPTQEFVKDVAIYIHTNYHPLEKKKHQQDRNYLASMLYQYNKSLHNRIFERL